jgi:hypothetical protein
MDGKCTAGEATANDVPAGSFLVGEEHLDTNGHVNIVRRTSLLLMDI